MFIRTTPRLTQLALAALLLATGPLSACGEAASQTIADPYPTAPAPSEGSGSELVQSDLQRDTSPDVPAADLATQVEANTAFAFELYRQIAAKKAGENLIYSPYSVSSALAMTYAGARGQTEADMAETLNFVLAQDDLHPFFNYLDLELESRGESAEAQDSSPFRLKVANALWGQEGFGFHAPFLDTLALNYGAGLQAVDFVGDHEGAREIINAWVEAETEERIKDLLPEGTVDPLTVLVLTNAIYFDAAWAQPFDEGETADADFTLADGSTVTTPLMNQLNSFRYASLDDVDAIELPYDGDEVSMLVLVPDDLPSLEAALTTEKIAQIDTALASTSVQLSLPKFEVDSDVPLSNILRTQMGMASAFAGGFSGISDRADLKITDVLHKAFVKLDEEGTEAAAATAVIIGGDSVLGAEVTMAVDRPFLYLIRDNATGTVLFVGRVLDPTL